MLEYIAYVIGFIATMLGVIGKTTREHRRFPKNLTTLGWVSVVVSTTALTISILTRYNDKVEKDRYRFWALRELEFTTYKLLKPYLVNTDQPTDTDRYKLTAELIKIGMFTDFCAYRMMDSCHCYPNQTYAELATNNTKECMAEMDGTLSRFSNYLPADIVELCTELRTDPWTEVMVNSNQRLQGITKDKQAYQFYGRMPRLQKMYQQKAIAYSYLVKKLEETIGKKMIAISGELHIKNPPPAFLFPLDR